MKRPDNLEVGDQFRVIHDSDLHFKYGEILVYNDASDYRGSTPWMKGENGIHAIDWWNLEPYDPLPAAPSWEDVRKDKEFLHEFTDLMYEFKEPVDREEASHHMEIVIEFLDRCLLPAQPVTLTKAEIEDRLSIVRGSLRIGEEQE